MKRFGNWLRNFFFPPAGAPTWVKLLPYTVLGVLTMVLLIGAAYGWEYTNSPEFCGTTCHTMPPEYSAYLASPHARIACVDCHIGKGFIATRISRKAGDIRHIIATTFKTYEYPIRAGQLRPARETCEKCHFPEKFSYDSLVEIKSFSNDKDNTSFSTYLVMKIGGGNQRQGLGKGIHWHIENKIYFLPTDELEQDIPYIRVMNSDGTFTEYVDAESGLDPQTVDASKLKEMDCITCHNRITHSVFPPEDVVDQLIARNLISPLIPEIHNKAIEVYSQIYETTEKGVIGIAGLEEYYRSYYPDFYAVNSQLIKNAIAVLQDEYRASVYPEQKSDWNTHPNNVGHKYFPGCYRCHDGKHLNAGQQAIRLECNLCHSVPKVAGPYDFVSNLEISRGPEPETHKNPNWISMHNKIFNDTCSNCHNTKDPGGTSNTSFCSNSACHGNVWKYAGFDAPALRKVIQAQLPPTQTPAPLPLGGPLNYDATIGLLLKTRCGNCHGANGILGLNVTTYASLMKGSQDGAVIIVGDPQGSLLVQKQSGAQPHFGQLSPEELQIIIQWISSGALEK
jgi:nitrate/TMAO reductase-like tetraheme cytochrome c subunit/mono/diheme cytochrome c family protein